MINFILGTLFGGVVSFGIFVVMLRCYEAIRDHDEKHEEL